MIENLNDAAAATWSSSRTSTTSSPSTCAARRWSGCACSPATWSTLQAELFAHLRGARAAGAPTAAQLEAARRFAGDGARLPPSTPAATRRRCARQLDRPLRVCGVVRNTGEPGGGPFWVRGAGRHAARRRSSSRRRSTSATPAQRAVFAAATHFNPVFMACGVRDRHGQPFDLRRFVDPSAVFIARKSKDGRAAQALERPGLWNGAMARWHTVFVEVPLDDLHAGEDGQRPAAPRPSTAGRNVTMNTDGADSGTGCDLSIWFIRGSNLWDS